jgi:predicted DCC family thiol-disulfide oxidoreductase YuxK
MTAGASDLVLFDGDCGLCQQVASWLAARHGDSVARWRPWQGEAALPPGVDVERLEREIVLVRRDGATVGGHRAFAVVLRRTPGWRAVGLLLALPGVEAIAGWVYRRVARHRRWVSQRIGLAACALPAPSVSSRAGERQPHPNQQGQPP